MEEEKQNTKYNTLDVFLEGCNKNQKEEENSNLDNRWYLFYFLFCSIASISFLQSEDIFSAMFSSFLAGANCIMFLIHDE